MSAAMIAHGRTLGEPRLSPDGSCVSFISSGRGTARLVTIDLDEGIERVLSSSPAPRSARPFGGGVYDWKPDGSALVFVDSAGGLATVPAAGGPTISIRPAVRGRSFRSPVVSPDGSAVACTVDDAEIVVVSLVAPVSPLPRSMSTRADFCFDPVWSIDGTELLWHEWDVPDMPWDQSRIVAVDPKAVGVERRVRTVAGGDGVAVGQPRFAADGRLAYVSDRSGWMNVWVRDGADRALLADEHEHADPTWGPGQRSFTWSPDGRWIVHTRNEEGHGALRLVEVATGRHVTVSRGHHGGLDWRGDRVVAIRSGAATPDELIVLDLTRWTGAGPDSEAQAATEPEVGIERVGIEKVLSADAPLAGPDDGEGVYRKALRDRLAVGAVAGYDDSGALVEPELVGWPAPDGLRIPGRLYRTPRTHTSVDGGPPPLIVWLHGGPTDQWRITFRPRLNYFLDRGWSILVPDHRGSTGHGRAFAQALRGRWGDADTTDVAAGIEAAIDAGWADRGRIVVMGGSSGGFTVLNLLARHPGLCAAGVDLYGVADLADVAERTHRFEGHYFESIVGPTPDADNRYRERSPMSVIPQVRAPLLVLHGSEDAVVPVDQSQTIVDRLVALGRPVEFHVYEGEGHGFANPETVIDELERVEDFLQRRVLDRATGAPVGDPMGQGETDR